MHRFIAEIYISSRVSSFALLGLVAAMFGDSLWYPFLIYVRKTNHDSSIVIYIYIYISILCIPSFDTAISYSYFLLYVNPHIYNI
jgi:hypothetical protein